MKKILLISTLFVSLASCKKDELMVPENSKISVVYNCRSCEVSFESIKGNVNVSVSTGGVPEAIQSFKVDLLYNGKSVNTKHFYGLGIKETYSVVIPGVK